MNGRNKVSVFGCGWTIGNYLLYKPEGDEDESD